MVKVYCIDDKYKPSIIPSEHWLVEHNQYTIIHIGFAGKIHGCLLKELTIPSQCYPYEAFKLSRFAILQKDIPALIQLAMDCTKLSEVDVTRLLEQEEICAI